MNTSSLFRQLLRSNQLEFAMEAHSAISAKIVEEAGFPAVWASGLSISASMGVRDNNEASWTQMLDSFELMADATSIPILVDADTGYGNFNNVRRLVRKLEQRGVAAMCIEDKLFPKTNSFIDSDRQDLADMHEFAGKIRAAKDTQTDPDFSVVARVEALIAGWPVEEATLRAHAYSDAGADAILVHSKRSGPEQILEFMDGWDRDCPVVIVPTTYCNTPPSVLAAAGVSLAIWANQLLRSSVTAMQGTAQTIFAMSSTAAVEPEIASMDEIFRLQDTSELQEAEAHYLPARVSRIPPARAVQSAGGSRLPQAPEEPQVASLLKAPMRIAAGAAGLLLAGAATAGPVAASDAADNGFSTPEGHTNIELPDRRGSHLTEDDHPGGADAD